MDRAELEAAEGRLKAIRAGEAELERAQDRLNLINKHGSPKDRWKTTLMLKKDPQGNHFRDITVEVVVPFGVVQQQAIDAVQAARRAIIQAGGLA